jgi:hypothetical protein
MDNFGKIKYTYNSLLAEGISKNSSKEKVAFKKYIKTIKESEVLKTQFDVYYNIENKIELDKFKANEYVNECISLLDKFTKKEIKETNEKLAEPIINESLSYGDELKLKLYENINTLILTKKTPKNIDVIVEAKNEIVDYILNNKKEESIDGGYGLPNSVLSEIAVDKFNEEYAELTESEKEFISVMVGSNSGEKEILYKKSIKECLDLINKRLSESSGNIKEKLLATKETLLEKEYNEETFSSDVSKVLELKNTLTDN